MGHFGRRPIRFSWFGVVMPALLLCYLGIGALLLRDQEAVHSPFFLMSPSAVRVPVIILATLATIIASQALISGVFSIVLQGTKLGYLPRSRTINTSHAAAGQIYIPVVNWLLMAACVGLVLAFRSSSALAAAYGLSVTGTMFATTLLFAVFVSRRWHWPKALVFSMTGVLLAIEGAFLGANLFKIPEGGWFPLVVGAVVFAVFTTWKTGKRLVYERSSAGRVTVAQYARSIDGSTGVVRTEGTAVFLYSRRHLVPTSLIDTVKPPARCPARSTWSASRLRTRRRCPLPSASRRWTIPVGSARSCCATGSWSPLQWPMIYECTAPSIPPRPRTSSGGNRCEPPACRGWPAGASHCSPCCTATRPTWAVGSNSHRTG
jgi:KUP system potassium uptake protein